MLSYYFSFYEYLLFNHFTFAGIPRYYVLSQNSAEGIEESYSSLCPIWTFSLIKLTQYCWALKCCVLSCNAVLLNYVVQKGFLGLQWFTNDGLFFCEQDNINRNGT